MSDPVIRALAQLAPETGVAFFRAAARVLVESLGLPLAVVAERLAPSGRFRPRGAFTRGAWVEGSLGAPEDVSTLRDRCMDAAGAGAGAHFIAVQVRLEDGDGPGLLGVVADRELLPEERLLVDIVGARVAGESARVRTERELRVRHESNELHLEALLRLEREPTQPREVRLRHVLETVATTLDVERTSYWHVRDDGAALECEALFTLSRGSFESGGRLARETYPAYFEALDTTAALVVDDVATDPRTAALAFDIIQELSVTSIVAAPIWSSGRLAGVLGLAHVGAPRRWSPEEQRFATSAARTIAVMLEADLRARAEQRYRLLSNAIGEVLWVWDVETRAIEWNEGVRNVFGYANDATTGSFEWWIAAVHPGDRARVRRKLEEIVRGTDETWTDEYRFVRADGSTAFVRDRGVVVRDSSGKAVRMMGSMLDVTETKTLEQRLLLAERMASMGTLAAGVAHEINNPLAYVKGNVEHVLEQLRLAAGVDPDLISALEEAHEGAERVREIVHDLRTFSRPHEGDLGAVDIERVIETSLAIAKNEIRHRARLVKVLRSPPPVEANEARIGQVVLNLVTNAVQAIPEGASDRHTLRVETGVDARGRVFFEVGDTGSGIPADDLARIFDPFFTTKPVGEGTGLGLAIAHSIVSALGGEISVDSAPGAGSVFRVSLPRAKANEAARPAEPEPQRPLRRARVLVIDDDPHVAAIVRRSLARDHEVEIATGGREGLARLSDARGYDVIVCDLMMPDVSGADLFATVTRERPELRRRFLFMTGGAFTPRAQEFLAQNALPVLQKPFAAEELRRMVAQLV